jgi:hypothetical protein
LLKVGEQAVTVGKCKPWRGKAEDSIVIWTEKKGKKMIILLGQRIS